MFTSTTSNKLNVLLKEAEFQRLVSVTVFCSDVGSLKSLHTEFKASNDARRVLQYFGSLENELDEHATLSQPAGRQQSHLWPSLTLLFLVPPGGGALQIEPGGEAGSDRLLPDGR